MNNLLANQAFDTALIALMSVFGLFLTAIAGYIKVRTQQITQGAQLDVVQKQVANATATAPAPAVPAMPRTLIAASISCPQCGATVHLDKLAPQEPDA